VSVDQVALDHYRARQRLVDAAAKIARQVWGRIDPADLDGSWARMGPDLLVALMGAQQAAAGAADGYVDDVAADLGAADQAVPALNARALSGVASDGRPLASLLENSIFAVKSAIAGGATIPQAMASGYANLDMIVRTQVADAGRVADQVAITARPMLKGYRRMLVGQSCSRCVVLAGKWYRYNAGFQRHPRCDCIHVPAEDSGDSVMTGPRRYFDSLSRADQDKAFTAAGAQAIRDGADIGKVVNARRGMYTAGGKLYTREAAGRRPRIMPEQILRDARDRDDAIRLLRLHNYIGNPRAATRPLRAEDLTRRVIAPKSVAPVPTFEQRLAAATRDEKALDTTTFMLGRKPRPDAFTTAMSGAVNTYTGAEYNAINRLLRGQTLPYGYRAEDVTQTIADLDATMAASRVDRDVVTYRGVIDATKIFGDRLAGDLTGMTWREDAFVSTTAKARTADMFTEATADSPVVMRFLVPAGTPAVGASSWAIEAEILLARGRTLRVAADRGLDPHGIRHIDVEVLP
jgi:hypothetical protein